MEKNIDISSSNLPTNINETDVEKIYELLVIEKHNNEKNSRPSFAGFSDIELIVFYVYKKNAIKNEKDKSAKTKREYLRDLLQFYSILHKNKDFFELDVNEFDPKHLLKNLRPRHIESYQDYIAKAPLGKGNKQYKQTTLTKKLSILKAFFFFLYEENCIQDPLHLKFLKNSVTINDLPNRDLSYSEVSQILDFYKDSITHYTLLLLLATTGIRVAELANAKWKDIEFDQNECWLTITGKGNKVRKVYLFPYVFDSLIQYRKRRGLSTDLENKDNSPLISTFNDKPYSPKYLSKFITDIVTRTKFPFLYKNNRNGKITPHFYRHFYAIHSMNNGADLYKISKTLGHSTVKTTEIYLQRELEKKDNASLEWKNTDKF